MDARAMQVSGAGGAAANKGKSNLQLPVLQENSDPSSALPEHHPVAWVPPLRVIE